jgi:cytochrome c6
MKICGRVLFLLLIACVVVGLASVTYSEATEKTGEQLFKEHCSMCHPEGGNIINPKKTLLKKDLEINKIKTAEDVVKIVRKPGPGMTTFDVKSLSDKDARMIADYIFKKLNNTFVFGAT